MAGTIYHVVKGWDGGDLKSLKQRIDDGDLGLETWEDIEEYIESRWHCSADDYLALDGQLVHFHATLEEAIAYRDEHCEGGVILAFGDEDDQAGVGAEYPHPVLRGPVPAEWLKVVQLEAA